MFVIGEKINGKTVVSYELTGSKISRYILEDGSSVGPDFKIEENKVEDVLSEIDGSIDRYKTIMDNYDKLSDLEKSEILFLSSFQKKSPSIGISSEKSLGPFVGGADSYSEELSDFVSGLMSSGQRFSLTSKEKERLKELIPKGKEKLYVRALSRKLGWLSPDKYEALKRRGK